jgi:hypothetical protein
MRIEFYVSYRLKAGYINLYIEEVKNVIRTVDSFLKILAQSYKDLDEVRTFELQLIELR